MGQERMRVCGGISSTASPFPTFLPHFLCPTPAELLPGLQTPHSIPCSLVFTHAGDSWPLLMPAHASGHCLSYFFWKVIPWTSLPLLFLPYEGCPALLLLQQFLLILEVTICFHGAGTMSVLLITGSLVPTQHLAHHSCLEFLAEWTKVFHIDELRKIVCIIESYLLPNLKGEIPKNCIINSQLTL